MVSGQRTVIAISGQPASGKTSAALILAEIVDGMSIDSDLLCSPLRDAALDCLGLVPADVDTPFYQEHLRPAVYQCLMDTAAHLVQFGHPVIISAPFHPLGFTTSDWERIGSMLTTASTKLIRLHLTGQSDGIRARIVERGEPRDATKLIDWPQYQSTWADSEPDGVTVIVNDGTVEELRASLVQLFAGGLPYLSVLTT